MLLPMTHSTTIQKFSPTQLLTEKEKVNITVRGKARYN